MTDRPLDDGAAETPDGVKVVKLSQRDLSDARRLLSLLSSGETDVLLERPKPAPFPRHSATAQALQRQARDILANRRRRYDIFGRAMFGEPAWEMLLFLYVLQSGPRQTISRLADLARASRSTALRWIDYLHAQGLIRRETHPTDKRAAFVELTDQGRQSLELYLSDTLGPDD